MGAQVRHHSKIDVLGDERLSAGNEGQLRPRPFQTLVEARLHPNDVETLMQAAPSSSVQAAWKLGKKSASIRHRMRSSSSSLAIDSDLVPTAARDGVRNRVAILPSTGAEQHRHGYRKIPLVDDREIAAAFMLPDEDEFSREL